MGRTKPRCTRPGSEYSVGAVESGGSLGCSDRAFRLGGPHHGPAVRHVTFDITALAAGTLDPSSGACMGQKSAHSLASGLRGNPSKDGQKC